MSRQKNVIPTTLLSVRLPEPVAGKMNLHLFSEVEGRVPFGAHQRFLSSLINEFFSRRGLDISAFLAQPPGSCIVWGDESTIHQLTQKLEAKS